MIQELVNSLQETNAGKVLVNELLSKHTTMKIGGPADILFIPSSIENLQKAIRTIQTYQVPVTAIGKGSNLLVRDGGIEGVVIKLSDGLDHLVVNGNIVTVGGGYPLVKLATVMSRQGLSGLEFAGGIPASVGGAVYMNAGAHKSDFSKILLSAKVLLPNGDIREFTNSEMNYSYRTSILQKEMQGICIEATLQLVEGSKEASIAEMKKNKDYRKNTQPWNLPCAGSIFRNPLPQFAGKLIEEAGLKGYLLGGAQISPMHGNFIVNTGNATAKDVLELIRYVQKVIFEKFQVRLNTELEIIGRT